MISIKGKNELYRIFCTFKDKLLSQSIPIVRIRYIDDKNFFCSGDHDFIIPPVKRESVLQTLFSVCVERECSFLLDRKKTNKTRAIIYDHSSQNSLVLEFWTTLEVRNDSSIFPYIEWEKIQPHVFRNEAGYFLNIDFEALYYLSHLLTKRKNISEESVKKRLLYYKNHKDLDASVRKLYERLELLHDIETIGREANKIMIRQDILDRSCRADAVKRKIHQVFSRADEILFNKNRANRLISILGPDGVGKTSLIRGISEEIGSGVYTYRFKNYYRGAIIYRLLYPLIKMYVQNKNKTLYQRNQVEELYVYPIFLLSVLRYHLNIKRLFSRNIQITDRYFHDYILTGSRLNEDRIERHHKWEKMLKIIPRTLAIVQVDADNQSIHSRRSEISSEQIDGFRKEYFYLSMLSFSNFYVYLNNSCELKDGIRTLQYFLKRMKIFSQ